MRKGMIITAIVVLLVASAFGAGLYVGSKKEPVTIQVVKEVQGPTVYKNKIEYQNSPDNFEKLYSCYRSPILISTELNKNVLHIVAQDDCKQSSSDVTIAATETPNWKLRLAVGGVATAVVLAGGVYAGWKLHSAF